MLKESEKEEENIEFKRSRHRENDANFKNIRFVNNFDAAEIFFVSRRVSLSKHSSS